MPYPVLRIVYPASHTLSVYVDFSLDNQYNKSYEI